VQHQSLTKTSRSCEAKTIEPSRNRTGHYETNTDPWHFGSLIATSKNSVAIITYEDGPTEIHARHMGKDKVDVTAGS
jgi:hypothetical protein